MGSSPIISSSVRPPGRIFYFIGCRPSGVGEGVGGKAFHVQRAGTLREKAALRP